MYIPINRIFNNETHTPLSIDDPLIWGALPFKYLFNPDNMRWGLGSHDLCYQSTYVSQRQCLATCWLK